MKIPSIGASLRSYRARREMKFLDKYCRLNENLSENITSTLNPVRKMIANYAKSKGVFVEISDAEKNLAKTSFESDIDERMMKRAARGNLAVTVSTLNTGKKGVRSVSSSSFVPNNTKATKVHKDLDYIVVADVQDGVEYVRITSHEYQDGFLGMIYRAVSSLTENLTKRC